MPLHNMKTLAALAGVHPNTLYNQRKKTIDTNPELKKRFGNYGKKTSHLLTADQVRVLKENIPHLNDIE